MNVSNQQHKFNILNKKKIGRKSEHMRLIEKEPTAKR